MSDEQPAGNRLHQGFAGQEKRSRRMWPAVLAAGGLWLVLAVTPVLVFVEDILGIGLASGPHFALESAARYALPLATVVLVALLFPALGKRRLLAAGVSAPFALFALMLWAYPLARPVIGYSTVKTATSPCGRYAARLDERVAMDWNIKVVAERRGAWRALGTFNSPDITFAESVDIKWTERNGRVVLSILFDDFEYAAIDCGPLPAEPPP